MSCAFVLELGVLISEIYFEFCGFILEFLHYYGFYLKFCQSTLSQEHVVAVGNART